MLYRAAVPARPLRCACRPLSSPLWRSKLYSTSSTTASTSAEATEAADPAVSHAVQEVPLDAPARPLVRKKQPIPATPALQRLLRGGERPVPMPYREYMAGQKLVAVPVKDGEEPLYVVAPDDLPAADRPWVRWAVLGFLFLFLWACVGFLCLLALGRLSRTALPTFTLPITSSSTRVVRSPPCSVSSLEVYMAQSSKPSSTTFVPRRCWRKSLVATSDPCRSSWVRYALLA